MSKKTKKIDVHHHFIPSFYIEKLKSIGITESYGQAFPKWTPETSLSFMKKLGIDIAILKQLTTKIVLICFHIWETLLRGLFWRIKTISKRSNHF